ncbi:MAG: type II secretion system F family protein [Bacillota bacterium]|nr:type II secretion system F family protein [Bacillota bacterium]
MILNTKKSDTLSPLDISLFFKELSLLLGSGISLSEAFYIMANNTKNDVRQQMCTQMITSIDSGCTLPEAAQSTGVLPPHVIQVLTLAQTSGKLDETISGLALYYERMDSLGKSVRNTMTFPLIMLAVMFGVLSVLIIKVLPLFGAVFTETGARMPLIVRLVTESKTFEIGLIMALILILGLVAAAFISGGRIITTSEGSSGFMSRFPVISKIRQKAQAGSFAYAMALLLSGGITTEEALQLECDMSESLWIREKSSEILTEIRKGETLSSAISKCSVFDGYYPALLAAGEKSGESDKVMNIISDRYSEEINDKINSLLGFVEPILVITMTLIVGSILLSIMVPLMNVMASI